jgi:serine/threonine-protein kinase RIM15
LGQFGVARVGEKNPDVFCRTEPEELPGSRISRFLHPDHWNVFREATLLLQEDDSHTIEVKFQIRTDSDDVISSPRFQLMEGKGMLMIDREDGHPSHTMWVIKPAVSAETAESQTPPTDLPDESVGEQLADAAETPDGISSTRDPLDRASSLPASRPVNTTPILCRICECAIPQWYFERHNETCVETHRLEAEVMDCNESIGELRSTIRELIALIERSSPAATPEYRGMPILSPSTSPNINPSPLSLFRGPLSSKVQKMGVKKMQRRLLEQLDDILTVAAEIEVPALRDDESKEPIERQMLMSPSSERKMTQVRGWFKPTTEDGALTQLLDDSDRVMRQKTDNVIRMRNTIKYSEKVRQEWEERVLKALSQYDEDEERDEDIGDESMVQDEGPFEEDAEEPQSASSTTSEYAFNGEEHTASTASLTTIAPTPESITEVSRASPEQPPLVAPRPHPPAHHARPPNSLHNTRSSTPASVISSPLALVPPIVASPSPPPPMDLNDHAEPELPLDRSTATIRSRRSTPNLQPKLLLTPPMSPVPSPKESTTAQPKRMHRRQSTTASAILSPSNAIVPLSPRFHGPTPVSRAAPTSIKDFDIIKPISKGAFGSVFLAKKKATGDYYAIKVLKKADMIAKNQVTNVKAERMILMTQSESPFVAKLYFTFQSKENLYLVMEYLNGGDCNNLLTALGTLPEEWAKNYIAEVVLGLESLHSRGVVHR